MNGRTDTFCTHRCDSSSSNWFSRQQRPQFSGGATPPLPLHLLPMRRLLTHPTSGPRPSKSPGYSLSSLSVCLCASCCCCCCFCRSFCFSFRHHFCCYFAARITPANLYEADIYVRFLSPCGLLVPPVLPRFANVLTLPVRPQGQRSRGSFSLAASAALQVQAYSAVQ